MKRLFLLLALVPLVLVAEPAIEIPEVVITGETTEVADSVEFETPMQEYWKTPLDKNLKYEYLPPSEQPKSVHRSSSEFWGSVSADVGYLPSASVKVAVRHPEKALLSMSAGLNSKTLDSDWKYNNGYFQWTPRTNNLRPMFRSWFHKFSNDDLSVETNGFGAYGDLSMQNLFENEQAKLTNQKLRFGFDYSSSDFNEKETTFRPELSSSSDILLNKFSSNVKLNIDYMMGKASTEAKIKIPGVEIKNLPGSIEFEEPSVWLAADDNHFYGSIDFLFSSDVTDKAEIEVFNKPYRTMRNAEVYYQLNPYLKDGEEVNPSKTPLNLGTALNIDNMIPLRFEYAFKFHYDLPVFYPVFDSQTGTITPLWQIGLTDALEQRFTLTTNIAYQDLDISGEFIYSHLRDKDSYELPYYANMIAKIGFGYVYDRLTTNLEVIYDDGRIDHLGDDMDARIRSNVMFSWKHRTDLSFYVKADNIFNSDYQNYLNTPEAEIDARLGVKYNF
jgi:hypothetical protein